MYPCDNKKKGPLDCSRDPSVSYIRKVLVTLDLLDKINLGTIRNGCVEGCG
jgi:hypothetical protein